MCSYFKSILSLGGIVIVTVHKLTVITILVALFIECVALNELIAITFDKFQLNIKLPVKYLIYTNLSIISIIMNNAVIMYQHANLQKYTSSLQQEVGVIT